MNDRTRREFLADVGRGMLVASVGSTLAADLGLSIAEGAEVAPRLTFGPLEPLVTLLQETPADRLLPLLVERLHAGTSLRDLVAAGALANARAFGGEDYTGYHTFMALAPAYEMSRELPAELQPLPVLKVLHRNTRRLQETGSDDHDVLQPVSAETLSAGQAAHEQLLAATRQADAATAERVFAALAQSDAASAYDALLYSIQDQLNVHRVVLAWRAQAMLDLTGKEHAHTLLRQSVRFCVDHDKSLLVKPDSPQKEAAIQQAMKIRTVLPSLLDQYRLVGRTLGDRDPGDAWVERMSESILTGTREQAADAVAAALAEGVSPEVMGEAISLAANQLVLRDPGRPAQWSSPEKPEGSVHGDSVGVHASDAANAWRNIARVSNQRNTIASLIVGAYHTAGQNQRSNKQPFPLPEQLEQIRSIGKEGLLAEAERAIRGQDQVRACTLVHQYGVEGGPARPMFDLLLRFATSEDGALHAEKYYRTVSEEFNHIRPAFRWRQLAALARVTASEYGRPAPGIQEACGLLKVSGI